MKIRWRRWNAAIHRDVGYACVALTIVYAVSGIAVNHINDWNPNYRITREQRRFEPVPIGEREAMVAALVERLGLPEPPKESFRPRPEVVELFYDGWSVRADAVAGTALIERTAKRPGLYEANFLHLNRPRGWWTWIADLYAALLATLALTGIFILRGRDGIVGRGKWIALAGLLVPILFLVAFRIWGSGEHASPEREQGRRGRRAAQLVEPLAPFMPAEASRYRTSSS